MIKESIYFNKDIRFKWSNNIIIASRCFSSCNKNNDYESNNRYCFTNTTNNSMLWITWKILLISTRKKVK